MCAWRSSRRIVAVSFMKPGGAKPGRVILCDLQGPAKCRDLLSHQPSASPRETCVFILVSICFESFFFFFRHFQSRARIRFHQKYPFPGVGGLQVHVDDNKEKIADRASQKKAEETHLCIGGHERRNPFTVAFWVASRKAPHVTK